MTTDAPVAEESSVRVEHTTPEGVTESLVQAVSFGREHVSLWPDELRGNALTKIFKLAQEKAIESKQGVTLGRKPHPFDRTAVNKFQISNVHHSTCIKTKAAATTGLGFSSKEDENGLTAVDRELNPFCENSFADVLNDVDEDFWQCGEGGMEIVRADAESKNPRLLGIHHIPCATLHRFLENARYDSHFEITTGEGADVSRRFARFGDLKEFIARAERTGTQQDSILFRQFQDGNIKAKDIRSEVIIFRNPTSLSRWYGFPDWLAATASIELVQCMLQHNFDFFLNRGVPEFLLFIMGQKLGDDDWKKIENAVKANIGLGNSHKSTALNFTKELKIQLEKLAMEDKSDDGQVKLKENLALDIVSAHRVPPLLAGIQIPGKLGATNELPNAIMAFYILVIAPAQRIFEQTLGCTLGDSTKNGGISLTPKDFKLKTIVEMMDLEMMRTVGGMRDNLQQARAEGRDLDDGLQD